MNEKTTRDHIVEAADQLFYQQGYEHTSFAHIADAVGIARGNFYYHFKSKDEILDAVIGVRLDNTRAMLDRWEREGRQPADRIRSFINILIANRAYIKRHGCPVGTLCTELAKLNHASQADANKLFTLFRTWLRQQFTLLGCKPDADTLAMHLLARSQGVATLANAFQDERFIKQEVKLMNDWLDSCTKSAASAKNLSQLKLKGVSLMFVVLLKFSDNKGRAKEFMEGHNEWIKRGFDDGVFLLAGSLQPNLGGSIVANNISLSDLQHRVNTDPFVAANVVSAEILEITPSKVDERLKFLVG